MWKDYDSSIEKIYLSFKSEKKFPTICPVCNEMNTHIYMHIHNYKTRKGGLWIWCSKCCLFFHSAIIIPEYWENCTLVEDDKLYAVPEYLDEIKGIIDAHVNNIKSHIVER